MIFVFAYKIDNGSWQSCKTIIEQSKLEDIRKDILACYPGANKCLFMYEEC